MSGLLSFLGSMISSVLPVASSVLAHGWKGFKTAFQSMSDSTTGAHLTNAQNEANAFSAQQAQNAMDFTKEMSNTAYQRQIEDMKKAGVNPALAMSASANGASSPSGVAASSQSVGQPDVIGLMTALSNLSLLKAQKDNIVADTENKRSNTDLSRQNIVKSASEVAQIRANVRKLDLESDAQEIVNSFLERREQAALNNLTLSNSKLSIEYSEVMQRVSNLKTEQMKTLQDIAESVERVNYLLKQESLSDAQRSEVYATVGKINQETSNLVKSGALTQKDIDFYSWNHMKGVNFTNGFIDEQGNLINFGSSKGIRRTRKNISDLGNYFLDNLRW